jgi:hypothetical protein
MGYSIQKSVAFTRSSGIGAFTSHQPKGNGPRSLRTRRRGVWGASVDAVEGPDAVLRRAISLMTLAKVCCVIADSFLKEWASVYRALWTFNRYSLSAERIANCLMLIAKIVESTQTASDFFLFWPSLQWRTKPSHEYGASLPRPRGDHLVTLISHADVCAGPARDEIGAASLAGRRPRLSEGDEGSPVKRSDSAPLGLGQPASEPSSGIDSG